MSEIIQKLNPRQNTVEQVHVILRKDIIDMRLKHVASELVHKEYVVIGLSIVDPAPNFS